ncbi:FAD-dependent monooxygenase [Actinopolymorpha alba]|uniref:FAD-dependent monooxygenase n=1 Tax=Actinopolymorpha alba TaxID=533267 RepID=UPI00036CB7F1|nr:FAD-dependent monooxygenase [Actinopolymorpha alba]
MPKQRRAVVVGAGIGGLAAAGALVKDGWSVELLESGHHVRGTGAGLGLWPNAVRAMDALDPAIGALGRGHPWTQESQQGAPDAVQAGSGPAFMLAQGGLRTPDGRWLTRIDATLLEEQSSGAPIIVTRTTLHAALASLVPAQSVRLGRTATRVDLVGREAVVHAIGPDGQEGNEEYAADLVVAADGIGSRLRATVDPRPSIRSAGYVTWRGIVPPEKSPALEVGSETWGRGQRFGCTPLSSGGTYWYATLSHADPRAWSEDAEPGAGPDAEHQRDRLAGLFAGWHDPVPALIAATPPDQVLRNDVVFLWPLPRTFVEGRLALLGDAAHAMTPDLGQGACQALEDAVELATSVRSAEPAGVPAALPTYDRLRHARATGLARQARRLGQFSQLRHPWAVAVRDKLISLVPASSAAKGFAAATAWRPSES